MPRYYFDFRDGDNLSFDEDGMELSSIASVQEEAAKTLAEMARDTVRSPKFDGTEHRRMAVEVRNDAGPVLQVKFTFEVARYLS
ncbi:hypothetical protein CQ14_24565 [Bradyrhizobium lablabi]|uniref:DUF6894 domain-containing protein n=1 Tax=Bradyrhizobium lablabi TaxID=722472 RepID=A0A0R3MEL7_9BRAD|nr:hypothetical protein [Bradyrhizobium lablabi]KRR18569.1 hypothetical protein CQ14_24565 [Bradyrhizobium lablabi]